MCTRVGTLHNSNARQRCRQCEDVYSAKMPAIRTLSEDAPLHPSREPFINTVDNVHALFCRVWCMIFLRLGEGLFLNVPPRTWNRSGCRIGLLGCEQFLASVGAKEGSSMRGVCCGGKLKRHSVRRRLQPVCLKFLSLCFFLLPPIFLQHFDDEQALWGGRWLLAPVDAAGMQL